LVQAAVRHALHLDPLVRRIQRRQHQPQVGALDVGGELTETGLRLREVGLRREGLRAEALHMIEHGLDG
jgi:hypothetical protein